MCIKSLGGEVLTNYSKNVDFVIMNDQTWNKIIKSKTKNTFKDVNFKYPIVKLEWIMDCFQHNQLFKFDDVFVRNSFNTVANDIEKRKAVSVIQQKFNTHLVNPKELTVQGFTIPQILKILEAASNKGVMAGWDQLICLFS